MRLWHLEVGSYLLVEDKDPRLTVWINMKVEKPLRAIITYWIIERKSSVLDRDSLCFKKWDKVNDPAVFKKAQEALDFWDENRDKIDTGDWV